MIRGASRYVDIVAVGSFCIPEIRGLSKLTAPFLDYKLHEYIFFHTAGDLQEAAHSNKLKRGDTVFFNGGSLLWNQSQSLSKTLKGVAERWKNVHDHKVRKSRRGPAARAKGRGRSPLHVTVIFLRLL
jgi:hypothetical protein